MNQPLAYISPENADPLSYTTWLGGSVEMQVSVAGLLHTMVREGTPLDINQHIVASWYAHEKRDQKPDTDHLWTFTRFAKGHKTLFGVSGTEAFAVIDPVVQEWPRRDGSDNGWTTWFEIEPFKAEDQIVGKWPKIHSAVNKTVFHEAAKRTDAFPIDLGGRPLTYQHQRYRRFITFAAHLQAILGRDKTILLPRRQLGQIFEVSHVTIGEYCHAAIADGYLKMIKKGTINQSGRRFAAEYLFLSKT